MWFRARARTQPTRKARLALRERHSSRRRLSPGKCVESAVRDIPPTGERALLFRGSRAVFLSAPHLKQSGPLSWIKAADRTALAGADANTRRDCEPPPACVLA